LTIPAIFKLICGFAGMTFIDFCVAKLAILYQNML